MESKRVIVLVVAVVLGAVAALATFAWLSGIQDRANDGAALVQVYVVKKDVPKGLPGEKAIAEKYIQTDNVQAKFRPANALVSGDAVKGKVALVALPANSVLIDGLFVDPRVAQVTNSQRVEPGRVAVSIGIDGVKSVSGLLVPGDKVNIMSRYTADARVTPRPGPAGTTATKTGGYAMLYQNVEILFIGGTAAPTAGETAVAANPGSGVFTFSVPQEAAERLVLASETGGLYLTLVPPNNPAVAIPPVDNVDVFGPACDSPGGDNQYGTFDDTPTSCVPLSPYVAAPPTTLAAPQP